MPRLLLPLRRDLPLLLSITLLAILLPSIPLLPRRLLLPIPLPALPRRIPLPVLLLSLIHI